MPSTTDVINTIINNALVTADTQTQAAEDAADTLIQRRAGAWYPSPGASTGFSVEAIEPDIPTVADSTLTYEAQLEKIIALLSNQLAEFFALYYPLNSDAFPYAQSWLINVITNGGTGINANIEDQIWQRDRERTIADGRRVENQLIIGFAAKGHFLPQGALTAKISEARFDQTSKTSAKSTSIAEKQIDVEIATVKFAVEQAIASRSMAMRAAADYIRAVASAPAEAVNIASLNTDAQAKMMAAAASWYDARLNRDRIVLSSKLAEMNTRVDIYKQEEDSATRNSQVDVQALAAAADVYAKTAQAALMSLNSVVSATTSAFG